MSSRTLGQSLARIFHTRLGKPTNRSRRRQSALISVARQSARTHVRGYRGRGIFRLTAGDVRRFVGQRPLNIAIDGCAGLVPVRILDSAARPWQALLGNRLVDYMAKPHGKTVYLFDVDNTLLDNDRVIADLKKHLDEEVGLTDARQYWEIFEKLRARLGYADYLGALQTYRRDHPSDLRLLRISRFLINYPFANRLLPSSLDVLKHFNKLGWAVLLSDGDVVFQPHKIDCSGLAEAVDGRVLIYVHKERQLDDVRRRYPSPHYVLIDDKLRILTAVKRVWRQRVTTVFVRQGHYARDPKEVARYPAADLTIEQIADLLNCDLS